MDLFSKIIETYPELEANDFGLNGAVHLRDDGDGIPYISKWDYSKPIPAGLKVGK